MTFPPSARRRRIGHRCLMMVLGVAALGLPLHAFPLPQAHQEAAVGQALTSPAEASAARYQELSVEQILERHYEASGGDDFQWIRTMKVTGTSVVMGMEAPYARFSKRPNKMKLEIYVEGMTGVQAFDGETAWSYMPFAGQSSPEAMAPAQARALQDGADFDGALVDAASKGHEVELLGVEEVDGRPAYVLEVTMSGGSIQTHYVDAETYYTVRLASADGEASFREYREIDGHPIPAVIEMKGPYGQQVVYIDDVEYDVPIEDSAFRMR